MKTIFLYDLCVKLSAIFPWGDSLHCFLKPAKVIWKVYDIWHKCNFGMVYPFLPWQPLVKLHLQCFRMWKTTQHYHEDGIRGNAGYNWWNIYHLTEVMSCCMALWRAKQRQWGSVACRFCQDNKMLYNKRTIEQNKSVCNSSAMFLSCVALL